MADRSYEVTARTTEVFGRVMVSCRTHHWIVDAPDPGEELTPGELFLGGIAACAAELIERIAPEHGIDLAAVRTKIDGTIPEKRIREDVNLFSRVRLDIEMAGVNDAQAAELVEAFKRH